MPAHSRRAIRIETEGLLLRPFREGEAEALRDAVIESLPHLRPWLPWAAHEPETVEQKRERIRAGRRAFLEEDDLRYGVFLRGEERVIGGAGLHDRGDAPQAFEIGYWIAHDQTGRGHATELSAALTRAGFVCEDASRIEIHCDPRNGASAAVPRKLGYRLREIREAHREGPDGRLRAGMIWELLAEDFAASPAAAFVSACVQGADLDDGSPQPSRATP